MNYQYIVELEPMAWLADWNGDSGRTICRQYAKVFNTEWLAQRALKKAQKYKPFKNAKVVRVSE